MISSIRYKSWILPFLLILAFAALPALSEDRINAVLVSGSEEYDSDQCFELLKEYLEAYFPIRCVLLRADGFTDLPGLGALDDADIAIFYTRRLTLPDEQLEKIKAYMRSDKPVIAIRTASHGFQTWLEMDAEILGGNYDGHHGSRFTQTARPVHDAGGHPILEGVGPFASPYSLYKTSPLADDCTPLMTSEIPNADAEPAAWTREIDGKRVFYTSLGGLTDFENAAYLRLLSNAIFWALDRPAPALVLPVPEPRPTPQGDLILPLRSRAPVFAANEELDEFSVVKRFAASETAIIVCDMWDRHWCRGATERVDEMVGRMAQVLRTAQERGMLIIHAPSDTLRFYDNHPQRIRALMAEPVEPPHDLPIDDPPLPIDDASGGCDTGDTPQYRAWSRQHPGLPIGPYDAISDNGREVYNLFQAEGIKNVIMMGVHTNMCVLHRSFAIRQMTRWGFDCILVRDLTDAMYDPNDYPYVSQAEGTELVIEHIETYWGPTTTSRHLSRALAGER